jgi:hypothetical protein
VEPAGDRPASPAIPKKPSSPPGAKKARHQRWKRVAVWGTTLVIVGFAVALGFVLTSWFRTDPEAGRVKAGRVLLEGIATQIGNYDRHYAHLPERLSQLRDPALPSLFESDPRDPWYSRIEFEPQPDGVTFRLRSHGPDKAKGTADDLVLERRVRETPAAPAAPSR